MKKLVAVGALVLAAAEAAGSDLGWMLGVDVVLDRRVVRGAVSDPRLVATAKKPAPERLTELPGTALAGAIRDSKDLAVASGRPMPPQIRKQLALYVSKSTLDKVRYSLDWRSAANETLRDFAMGTSEAPAITLDDTIVFRDEKSVGEVDVWIHELTHVEQYSRMGIDGFANRYANAHWTLEEEAATRTNRFRAASRPVGGEPFGPAPAPVPQGGGYFLVDGDFYFGDQLSLVYPADRNTGRVVGPPRARMTMQKGKYVAYDSRGTAYAAIRVR